MSVPSGSILQQGTFQANRERKASVANSIKFNHTRSSSKSSIDEELFQPPTRIMNRERGSFESLSSNRNNILDDIEGQQQNQQPRASTLFFKSLNNSSSTLIPLTRTVSFNSIHNGSPMTSPMESSKSGSANDSSNNGSSKSNRLTRLFAPLTNKSGTGGDSKSSSRGSFPSNRSSLSLSGNTTNGGKTVSKPNLLQRQISVTRSIKEKRNVKKPVDLSIQTSNLAPSAREKGNSIELKDAETLSGLPNLTEALSYANSANSALSPQLVSNSSLANASKSHKHHHLHINHHNLLRPRNKDNPLSSSSSNSKLISGNGETLYSFSMSGGNFSTSDLQRTFQQLELLNFKDLDLFGDKGVMADECYSLLSFLVLPIFKGETLRVPIEDLNRLVQLFLYLRIQEFHSSATPTKTSTNLSWSHRTIPIFEEIQSLFEQGFQKFNERYLSSLSNISTESKVVKSWNIFRSNILFYLEGVFLPLQLELQGDGILIKQESHYQIWHELTMLQDLSELYIKRLILMGFRDTVIIPIYEDDEEENWIHEDAQSEDDEGAKEQEKVAVLQQCFSILQRIGSNDSSQNLIERLLKDILEKSTG